LTKFSGFLRTKQRRGVTEVADVANVSAEDSQEVTEATEHGPDDDKKSKGNGAKSSGSKPTSQKPKNAKGHSDGKKKPSSPKAPKCKSRLVHCSDITDSK
jgi:hypothetical protein